MGDDLDAGDPRESVAAEPSTLRSMDGAVDATPQPLVIGGLGGSGTRVVTAMAGVAGWWMGGRVKRVELDSLAMGPFLDRWFDTILAYPRVAPWTRLRVRFAFRQAISAHRTGIPRPDAQWGWKNPRNMWLVAFFAEAFPRLRFVHVVRDARDMALSTNRFLLSAHGRRILGRDLAPGDLAGQMELWRVGNDRAANAGARLPTGHYLRLRYEDICERPAPTALELASFLGCDESLIPALVDQIEPSPGIGRWREVRSAEMDAAIRLVAPSLARYGYEL